ncbi:MATE family efflux transporter [Candidatus Epulonipiscium viviparus]|uniref:MATE family efflux transporter n=1 Tax=Candidatus Epulonipiscium viviparus TaxID=420336 RepID=UPI002738140C|nr:MATE family efflux transporter [Candidatus Epulopiscium viviparus]
MVENNLLLKEGIGKLFIKFTIPALLAMIITGAQSIIDGLFVGNFIGATAMASINIASPFVQLILGIGIVCAIGAQSHIGINLGMGETEEAKNTFQTFFRIIIVLSIVMTAGGFLFAEKIAIALGADVVLLADSVTYIRIYSLFALPICLMVYWGFLDRIVGRPELYFGGCILSLLTNLTLNYILVVRLGVGIAGAAIATGAAFVSAMLVVMPPMLNKKNSINIIEGKFSTKCIFPVICNGASEGVNTISGSVCVLLFNVALMEIAGADGVVAFTVINYVALFATLMLFGISDGIGPIVSYNYGSGNMKRVRAIMKTAYIINFVVGMIICVVLFFFGEDVAQLFIKDDPELVAMASNGGRLYGFAFLLAGFNILSSGYFTFIGKGAQSVIVASSRGIIFIVIGISTLPALLGVDGIWLSVFFAEVCAIILAIILLKKSSKVVVVTKKI